jgi:hypothetical protein
MSHTTLTVAAQRQSVAALPGRTARRTNDVVCTVSLLPEPPVGTASRGESAALAVLHYWSSDPVNLGVVADSDMVGVHENDLKVLVGRVLVHPIRVENAHVCALGSYALLSNRTQRTAELNLVDTLVLGLTEHNTLGVRALAATTAHCNTVHYKTLEDGRNSR